MGDDVHVRLQADVGRHGVADTLGAARRPGAAVDLVDLNDRGVRVIKGGRGLGILRVEGPRKPQVAEVWRGSAQIGRASCRERVCQYVYISAVDVSLNKKKPRRNTENTQTTMKK